jgi:soluble P-type ATPase
VIDIAIPGFGRLVLTELVCDYNGTLARDGCLLAPARELLPRVADLLRIHVVTADTHGSAQAELGRLPCELTVLGPDAQAEAKAAVVAGLGAGRVAAVGNGRNDAGMLKVAALGIGVVGDEGIAAEAIAASSIVCGSIADALELLIRPRRLVATLRA